MNAQSIIQEQVKMGILKDWQMEVVLSGDVEETSKFIIDDKGSGKKKTRMAKTAIKMFLEKERARRGKARELLFILQKKGAVPENLVKQLVEEEDQDIGVVLACAEISANQIEDMPNERTFSAMFECLWHYPVETLPILTSTFLADNNKKNFMEALLRKRPEIVLKSLRRGDEGINEKVCGLFLIAANTLTIPVILDILEDCVHSKTWRKSGTDFLETAQAVNPIFPLKDGTVRVDTSYLMNWGKEKGYFLDPGKTEIRDLIDHLCLAIEGCDSLTSTQDFVKKNRIVDLLMFLPNKRYRGHDIHHFNVAVLGLFFLDTYINKDQTLKEYISAQCKLTNPLDVVKTWLTASLLHDHALPMSYMLRIAHVVNDIKQGGNQRFIDAVQKLQEALEETYSGLFSDDLSAVYNKYREGYDDKTLALKKLSSQEMMKIGSSELGEKCTEDELLEHGVLGAVNMTGKLGIASKDRILKTSARAIAIHNLKSRQVSFKRNPIDFLLVLCDELQEWGRELAFFPEIIMEGSSMRMGKFDSRGNKLSFPYEICVSYRFLRSTVGLTHFDKNLFMKEKRKFARKRLAFDDPETYPQKITFLKPTFGI